MATLTEPKLYGLMAEFDSPESVLAAADRVRLEGYSRADAFAPFAIQGLGEAIGARRTRKPLIVLIGGIVGGLTGFIMQWYANVISYPQNIAGRPANSWPAWIPITFELTVLGASLSAIVGMLILNGLPQLYHPVFNVARFQMASRDRFFIAIEAKDAKFDRQATRVFLESLNPLAVDEIPA